MVAKSKVAESNEK